MHGGTRLVVLDVGPALVVAVGPDRDPRQGLEVLGEAVSGVGPARVAALRLHRGEAEGVSLFGRAVATVPL